MSKLFQEIMQQPTLTISARPSFKTITNTITTGLALFSMFFGAGNLIFPLIIGKSVGSGAWFAIMGLGLTAVIMPFFGLATMVLYEADNQRFFGRIGKVPGLLLLLLLQLILGPLGVIPRLVTLMHAMAKPYLFNVSLTTFSLLMAVVILICSIKRQKLISLLGALTPILLLSIAALVWLGLSQGSPLESTLSSQDSFLQGLVGGYHTMDLIAAFIFATVILPRFKTTSGSRENSEKREVLLMKKILPPSLIAASLLFLTYVGLCWISSFHGWTLDANHPPEQLLNAIATKLLGPWGAGIAAVAVIVACLTTAITLTATFADYMRTDLLRTKIGSPFAIMITLGITTLFANLGFGGIAAFLGPILQIVYPGLILLTLLNLLHVLYGIRIVKVPVLITFALSAVYYVA